MARYTGYVTRVIDGDTFKIGNITIRIADIDVPEKETMTGVNATNYLRSLIEGKEIIYETEGTGYHGRTLAYVWRKLDNLNISRAMVNADYAVWR